MLRILTFITAMLFASAAAATQVYVNAPKDGYLNLRTGPSTWYHVISKMKHGSAIHVISAPGKWYKVRDKYGSIGWAHSNFMSTHPQPVYQPHHTPKKYYVDAPGYSGLNLRKGPGTQYHKIMTMPQGSSVKVLQTAGKWWKVKHQSGYVGWAHKSYLTRHQQYSDHDQSYAKPHNVQPYQGIANWEAILQKCSHRPPHKQRRCVARHLGY